ncbi:type II toxin-antitoxin system RelE/ParE family toxin [Maricaulis salignorans]|uniref:ParE toxin of type II toxin-antitoxin system, parDE n=1 Tax=Maricaulis salignorans TaxID=144026 RepID=A0A1G9UZ10_9PROT|nr:type II toxin-antitoxin system RelE/ParE family toxin [Maricaulis salignorans]SDM65103.1 ParE toxin of type II toxin-antitoxin system, parDE [Maricaulis salignorans]
MKLVFSDRAVADLEEIGDYVALDNPLRAMSFIAELRSACARLSAFPEAAPLRPELGEGLRGQPHGQYLIFYRIADGVMRIERILQGNRLFPEAD